MAISLNINGTIKDLDVDPEMPLLWALRDILGMTGTKYGCGQGICGACAVVVDGLPERSCLLTVADAAGRAIETIEMREDAELQAVQSAWAELDVAQCGWCQSGQVLAARSLLKQSLTPDEQAIADAMDPQLCRCGTYVRIRKGVSRAADILKEGN